MPPSNKPKVDPSSPYGQLMPAQIPEAVGGLIGGSRAGLPLNYKGESWFAIANLSEYIYLKDDPTEMAVKTRSGQPLNGVGIFGRVGYAPSSTDTIARDASIASVPHGLLDARPYDVRRRRVLVQSRRSNP